MGDPEAVCPSNFFEMCVCVCGGGGGGEGGGCLKKELQEWEYCADKKVSHPCQWDPHQKQYMSPSP